jgi:cell division protein FtsZ
MAIMTGVQSAQVLGPTTQKQADRSRQSIEAQSTSSSNGQQFDARQNAQAGWQSDGGRDELEKNNGLDVIR